MRIFGKVLYKELRELLTIGFFLTLAVSFLLFYFLGSFMDDVTEKAAASATSVAVADYDDTEFSRAVLEGVAPHLELVFIEAMTDELEAFSAAKEKGFHSLVVIEKGFSEHITREGKRGNIKLISEITGVSISSTISSGMGRMLTDAVNTAVSHLMLTGSGIEDPEYYKNPIEVRETVVHGERAADIPAADLQGFLMSQSFMMPLVIYLVILMSSQTVASAIVTEKSDKTLETLFTAPVSRSTVLVSKMLAAGITSVIYSAVYIFAFSFYMSGMTGPSPDASGGVQEAAAILGFTLGPAQYAVIGVQLFLSILVALSISLILGTMVNDIKQIASVTMPLIFVIMIPFFITMFSEISALPIPFRIAVSLIPFTHSFTVTPAMFANDFLTPLLGMLYQFVFLVAAIALATHIINTDKIFTMSLNFGRKRKNRGG